MNTTVVVLGVVAGNVAMMGLVVKGLGDRIGDTVGRLGRVEDRIEKVESRADERHEVVMAKLNGIDHTLMGFDRRLKDLEH